MYIGTVSVVVDTAWVAPVSPRERVNAMIEPARIAGRIAGNRTRRKTCTGLAPRVRAVSSVAGSSCSRAPTAFRTTNGNVKATWAKVTSTTSDGTIVLWEPQNRLREIPRAALGTMYGMFTRASRALPRRRSRPRVMRIARGTPVARSIAVATPPTRKDTPTAFQKRPQFTSDGGATARKVRKKKEGTRMKTTRKAIAPTFRSRGYGGPLSFRSSRGRTRRNGTLSRTATYLTTTRSTRLRRIMRALTKARAGWRAGSEPARPFQVPMSAVPLNSFRSTAPMRVRAVSAPPVSLRAFARTRRRPVAIPERNIGSVIVRAAVRRLAPAARAAFSYSTSISSRIAARDRTMYGNVVVRCRSTRMRNALSVRWTAPGGNRVIFDETPQNRTTLNPRPAVVTASGESTSVLNQLFPRKSCRTISQARGSPARRSRAATVRATPKDSHRACGIRDAFAGSPRTALTLAQSAATYPSTKRVGRRTMKRKNATMPPYHARRDQRVETMRRSVALQPLEGVLAASRRVFTSGEEAGAAIIALRGSAALDDDVLENVRDVLATVRDDLQGLVDLLELDDPHGVPGLEELPEGHGQDVVREVLEAVHLDRAHEDRVLLAVLHRVHPVPELLCRLEDHVAELHHGLRGAVDLVDRDAGRGRVDVVQHVVQPGREGRDVLLRDRRHERLVQDVVQPVDDLVAPVLDLLDPLPALRNPGEVVHEGPEGLRARQDVLRLRPQGVEEPLLLGHHPLLQRHASLTRPSAVADRTSLRFSWRGRRVGLIPRGGRSRRPRAASSAASASSGSRRSP